MNGIIKVGLSFILGAGAGAVASALYFHKKGTKAIDEKLKAAEKYRDEKLAAIKAHYEAVVADLLVRNEELEESSAEAELHREPVEVEDNDGDLGVRPSGGKTDYSAVFKSNTAPAVEEPVRKTGAKEIPADAWGNDPTLEKIDLYYYTGNDALVSDNVKYDTDVAEMMIGADILEKFKKSRESTIWVRNKRHGSDYKIMKMNGRYEGD